MLELINANSRKQREDKKLQMSGKVFTSDKDVQTKEEIFSSAKCFYCDKKIETIYQSTE